MPYPGWEHVHLAIDMEYDTIPQHIPAREIGRSPRRKHRGNGAHALRAGRREASASEVLVNHRFEEGTIQNKATLRPIPNVEMALHADGFDTPWQKFENNDALERDEQSQYGGFQLFDDQDTSLLSPNGFSRG
jgi:hypothetical protein